MPLRSRSLNSEHFVVGRSRPYVNGCKRVRQIGNSWRTEISNKRLPGWPQFDDAAIRAVENVLRSGKVNYWTGPNGMEFEKRFAKWQGSKYAVSTATGTAALHVCCLL